MKASIFNKLKSHKKLLVILLCGLLFSYTAFSTPYFNGTMGIGGRFQPVPEKFPDLLMDAYFAGQFDLSQSVTLRTSLSMFTTESILKESIFQNTDAKFNLDEISLTYRGSVGSISHFLGAYIGEYDPVGSDIYLQRQFGIPSFASRLTQTICGISKAKIYDMAGIGGTYNIRFPQNVSLGFNIYYNKAKDWTSFNLGKDTEDIDFVESLNTDFRFAGAWRAAAIDLSVGLTMPMKKEITYGDGQSQNVILLIERADMHAGLTAFFGSSNSSSLLFQAGFTKLIIDPDKPETEKILSFDDVYILIEPRFISRNLCLSLALFNMPSSTKENLFYIEDPVGVNVSLYTPWLSLKGNKSQFGLMATMSSSKSLDNIMNNKGDDPDFNVIKENLRLFISPYGTICLGAGKLNFSLNVNAFDIKDWNTFLNNVSVIAGYKVQI